MDAEPLAGWTPRRLAVLTAVASLATALVFRGRVHPDEVFQALEPAHHQVFGYGIVAWEWNVGLRNFAVVDAIAGLLRMLAALHVTSPRIWVAAVWAVCSCWQGSGALALYRIIEMKDGAGPARLATFIFATWGGYLIYAARPIGDALALPGILWALWYVQRASGARDGMLAGTAIGVAVVARYPSLVFLAPLGLATLASRRASVVLGFVAAFLVVFGALGWLDYASWGDAFHSLKEYMQFNQPNGKVVSSFGKQPWWWYLPMFGALAPYFLAWQFARGLRSHLLATGTFFLYLLLVDVHPHKEERFLLPLLPLGLIIAAPATWVDLGKVLSKGVRWRQALVGGYAVWSGLSATLLRPFDLGRDELAASAFLGAQPILGGILLVGDWWSSGGYFYMHRDVPMPFGPGNDPRLKPENADGGLTHVLTLEAPHHAEWWRSMGWRPIWKEGEVEVWTRLPAPDGGR